MTEAVFAALRAAVTIAKNDCVTRVAVLRFRLESDGHKPDDVQQALTHWANLEARKRC